jgi:hypothetical protein
MRRIFMLVMVALVMAAMMLAMAMPAFAQGGVAGNCGGPPGQTINESAKVPSHSTPEAWGEPPGQDVRDNCAPGHLKGEEPI